MTFHELPPEQAAAERTVIDVLHAALEEDLEPGAYGRLVLVQGAVGTGKTALVSHLFNELATQFAQVPDGSGADAVH
ncbi:hypothetical protein [Paratractidigestivibacter sp.]|uniref:hypothetical protein n=1 Tax=Paratractidigestivibacter sp. TaxID=2847316 RepID=UPI002ABD8EBE|nr:hypothetical protein [Paratractidigestivibacter sp.]